MIGIHIDSTAQQYQMHAKHARNRTSKRLIRNMALPETAAACGCPPYDDVASQSNETSAMAASGVDDGGFMVVMMGEGRTVVAAITTTFVFDTKPL